MCMSFLLLFNKLPQSEQLPITFMDDLGFFCVGSRAGHRLAASSAQGFLTLTSSVVQVSLPDSLGVGRIHLAVRGLRSLLSCWLSLLRF